MDGLILVRKPEGLTSHDIIIRIRRILKTKKVGHFGTLDPLATGLLLIAVGKATRLFPFYLKTAKTYEGQIRLGYSTDTYDSDGNPLSKGSDVFPDNQILVENMSRFLGEIDQVPPPYSAKKYKGEALYKRVRMQKDYELKPAKVFIHYFNLKKYSPPLLDFEAKCSSGTYIRSLAHDLGQNLGCGAHLTRLVRTRIGEFHIRNSHSVEEIEELYVKGKTDKFLHPIESLLSDFPSILAKDTDVPLIENGREFYPDSIPDFLNLESEIIREDVEKKNILRVFDAQGRLLAFASKKTGSDSVHPFMVFKAEK
jgi:tRNA pseudouridine55 synthase